MGKLSSKSYKNENKTDIYHLSEIFTKITWKYLEIL